MKYLWLLCVLLTGVCSLPAQQPGPYAVEEFPFVRYDLNQLQFPGVKTDFEHLFGRMDELMFQGKGQINVVHIGGSHIQADMWSDRMRQRLQTFYPGNRGSRGILFPFRMAKTNNPYNYKAEWTGSWDGCRCTQWKRDCVLGMTGISVTTRDTASTMRMYFRGEDYPQYAFNRVRVLHDTGDSAFEVDLLSDAVTSKISFPEKGYTIFELGHHLTEVTLEFKKRAPGQDHFTLFGIGLESDDPGFVYHSVGVNGAATRSYLRCSRFAEDLESVRPDLVVFSIGINDANGPNFDPKRFVRNYDELVARVKSSNPDAAILFTTNNDSYYKRRYPNKNAEMVRDAMLELGQKHGAAVWDMYGVMGGLGSIQKWVKAGLANSDKIHLLKPGYIHVADLMFNALLGAYDEHLRNFHSPDAGKE